MSPIVSIPDQAIERLTRLCAQVLGASHCFAALADEAGTLPPDGLRLVGAPAGEGPSRVAALLCARVRETGAPHVVSDAGTDPIDSAAGPGTDVGAGVAVPLVSTGGRFLGCVGALDAAPRSWRDDELRTLADLAGYLAAELELRGEVAARERAEAELRASEERYRRLVEQSPDGVAVHREGRIVFVNPAVVRLAGAERAEQLVGRSLFDFIHPESRARVLQRLEELRTATGPLPSVELRFVRLDGSWIDAESIATPILFEGTPAYQVVLHDITQRKAAEAALGQTAATLQAIIHAAPQAIIAIDRQGRTTLWNAAAERIFGWTADEVLGKPAPIVPPEMQPEFIARRAEVLTRGSHTNYSTRRMRKDGTLVDVVISIAGVWGTDGALDGFVAVISDDTERRQLEEQFRQAQKMEAVGRLAGGIAHDFNNLLTAITANAELLLQQIGESDPLRADVGEIKRSADRAAVLTRQLLAFSRRQVLQAAVLDLNAVVTEVSRMLQRLLGEDVILTLELSPQLGRVKADPSQIEQVLVNLAVNARDAMPQGGTLRIRTADVALDEERARRHGVHPGAYVMLAVTDTGIGMDEATRARIFEPFFTTKEHGTGLGLATAYGIVKQSGGTIIVDSAPSRGSTFELYLPRLSAPAERPAVPAPRAATPKGAETILVVEDEEAVARAVRRILTRQGYHVLEARSGDEALRLVGEYADPIHLVLSDLVMPGISGRELVERIAPLRPEARVLFMSGYTDDEVIRRGLLDRERDFVQKPFSVDGIARKVREVLDR